MEETITADDIAALVERYHQALQRYIRRKGYPLQAEDFTQMVWTRLAQRLHDQQPIPRSHVGLWLYQLADWVMMDEYRRFIRRVVEHSLEALEVYEEPTAEDASECIIARERVRFYMACLAPKRQRALLLRCVGYTFAEIGEQLHISEKAAKQLFFNARRACIALREQEAS